MRPIFKLPAILMTTRTFILLSILITLILGCNSTVDQQKKDKQLREYISGDWEIIIAKENSTNDLPTFFPQGMTISNDSIDFYSGFYKEERDSLTGKRTILFLGNVVPYKTDRDGIIIKNPVTDNWEFKWRFVSRVNDTLQLAINDTTVIRYKKLSYNLDTLPDFDQIVYSSSGCFGSCPIIDISISKDGTILFQGEGFVKSLGFYSGNLDTKTKNYIFDKFRRANPLKLQDNYSVRHTDDQSLTTTYIQNGKIVKTIHDYGMAGTNELIWAYIPISNIHTTIKLDSLPLDDPFYPKLHYFTFKRDGLILPLEKSESFYLLTVVKKSKQTDEKFKSKYKLTFSDNYTYWEPDPNDVRHHKYEIKSVSTDGQFFKFEFRNEQSITYDLGYNFIDRNFKPTDFKKPNEWEE